MSMRKYPKYTWAMNKVSTYQMAELYRLKQETGRPITELVREAIDLYITYQESRRKGNRKK